MSLYILRPDRSKIPTYTGCATCTLTRSIQICAPPRLALNGSGRTLIPSQVVKPKRGLYGLPIASQWCTLLCTRKGEENTMRFVSVRELRGRSAWIWKELAEAKDLVITSHGKPIALLSATSEETLEESLVNMRRARALAAVTAMQQASVKAGTDRLTLSEVNAEIDAVRKSRRP